MKISTKANLCNLSPMRKFHPFAVDAQKQGKKIYHLNIGQPDIPTPRAYFEAINSFDKTTLAYDASPGAPVLIEAIRKYYAKLGVNLTADEIFITSGGSEALLFTCMSILDEGSEVIIPEPYYPNYGTFINAAGGKVCPLPTRPDDGYTYADRDAFEKLITPDTRALMITNPGNPTGTVLTEQEMRLIADIAKEQQFL